MKNKLELFVLFPIVVIVFILLVILNSNHVDRIFEEYPELKENECLNDIILDAEKYKGATLIKIKSGKAYSLFSFNDNIKPNQLYNHLEYGDSIVYEPGSKYVFLYKKNSDKVIKFEIKFYD